MALFLQNINDLPVSRYALLGCGAVIGATALLAICGSKYCREKRSMATYPNLRDNKTIMGRILTPEIFSKVKDKRTAKGCNIDKLIESGLHVNLTNNLEMSAKESLKKNSTGLLAGDEECYDIFSELIDPVISEVHQTDSVSSLKSEVNLNWEDIKGGNFYGANVITCRLSTSRNIHGYNMIPGCSAEELLDVGHVVVKALKSVEDKLHVCYLSLPCQYDRLSLDEYGLNPDSFPPQLSRDWPKGRFIWFTADRQCRIFVNFLDHIKFFITHRGGDMQKAFRQYSELLSNVEKSLNRNGKSFVWSCRYGFLTSSPNNVGTGLEVQVKVRLPWLIKDPRIHRIIDVLPVKLQHQGDLQSDVICITNKHKLQFTEVEITQQVINSITLLLELDKRMQRGQNLQDLLP